MHADICQWTQGEPDTFDAWKTDCDFERAEQCDPISFNYCPGCGKTIILVTVDQLDQTEQGDEPDPD